MSGFVPYTKLIESNGATVVIDKNLVGFPLDAAQGNYQITVSDLGPGDGVDASWKVDFLMGDGVWRAANPESTEQEFYLCSDQFVVKAFRVIFAHLGAATPKVYFVAQGRTLRFSTL